MGFFTGNRFPYTSYTDINLDWIMRKLKQQISGLVSSVNGKTGDVTLDASDVGALPDTYTPPAPPVSSVNSKTGSVVLDASDVGALPDTYTPPAAPVSSVNSKTGAVVLDASDVGALPDTYTPPAPPVTSVNGQTGDVTVATSPLGNNTPARASGSGSAGTASAASRQDHVHPTEVQTLSTTDAVSGVTIGSAYRIDRILYIPLTINIGAASAVDLTLFRITGVDNLPAASWAQCVAKIGSAEFAPIQAFIDSSGWFHVWGASVGESLSITTPIFCIV